MKPFYPSILFAVLLVGQATLYSQTYTASNGISITFPEDFNDDEKIVALEFYSWHPQMQNSSIWAEFKNEMNIATFSISYNYIYMFEEADQEAQQFEEAAAEIAEISGHPEINTAKWIIDGCSKHGYFATNVGINRPEKTLAVVNSSSNTSTQWIIPGAEDYSVSDWGSLDSLLTFPILIHVNTDDEDRPAGLDGVHSKLREEVDALATYYTIPSSGCSGHCPEVCDMSYMVYWMREIMKIRLDMDGELIPLKPNEGWLGSYNLQSNNRLGNTSTQLASPYPDNSEEYTWLPTAAAAEAWKLFNENGELDESLVPVSIHTSTLENADIDQPYRAQLIGSGGEAPYSWSVSEALPTGLELDDAAGLISGSPTEAGEFDLTVEMADNNGNTISKQLTVTVTGSATSSMEDEIDTESSDIQSSSSSLYVLSSTDVSSSSAKIDTMPSVIDVEESSSSENILFNSASSSSIATETSPLNNSDNYRNKFISVDRNNNFIQIELELDSKFPLAFNITRLNGQVLESGILHSNKTDINLKNKMNQELIFLIIEDYGVRIVYPY